MQRFWKSLQKNLKLNFVSTVFEAWELIRWFVEWSDEHWCESTNEWCLKSILRGSERKPRSLNVLMKGFRKVDLSRSWFWVILEFCFTVYSASRLHVKFLNVVVWGFSAWLSEHSSHYSLFSFLRCEKIMSQLSHFKSTSENFLRNSLWFESKSNSFGHLWVLEQNLGVLSSH